VKLLLDTHAIIWWLAGIEDLSQPARDAIADGSNHVHVSAASAWEIATKYRIGKLPQASILVHDFEAMVASQGFAALPISLRHATLAGSLEGAHRDPFDRMLIAQALADDLTLVSNERLFDSFGVLRLW
jgi:PIN domain nuclease of toxin-antitoxin system